MTPGDERLRDNHCDSEFEVLLPEKTQNSSVEGWDTQAASEHLEAGEDDFAGNNLIPPPSVNTNEFRQLAQRVKEINSSTQPESSVDAPNSSIDPEFVEVFFEEAESELGNIRENLAVWQANLSDKSALSSIRRSFHTLKGSGRMVAELTIAEFAWSCESVLNAVLDDQLAPSQAIVGLIDNAQAELQCLVDGGPEHSRDGEVDLAVLTDYAAALLRGETSAMLQRPRTKVSDEPKPPVSGNDIPCPEPVDIVSVPTAQDREMLEVFLEEASEILDSSEITLYRWSIDHGNRELLGDLRREMHTLKGSARMTGFMQIGDLAHAMESLLDTVAANNVAVSSDTVGILQRALDGLNDMVGKARSGFTVSPALELINDLKDFLAEGLLNSEQSAQQRDVPGQQPPLKPEPTTLGGDGNGGTIQQSAQHHSVKATDETVVEPDSELLTVFFSEAIEILNSSDERLQNWDSEQDNTELLNDLRREMHTLKGSSRMTGFLQIGDLAHAMESLLDAISHGSFTVGPAVVDILQRALDRISSMMGQAQGGNDITPAADLITEFNNLLGNNSSRQAPESTVPSPRSAMVTGKTKSTPAPSPEDTIRVSAMLLSSLVNQMGESSIYRARIDQGVGVLRFNLHELEQTIFRLRQQLRRLEIETEAQILFRYEEDDSVNDQDFDPLELDRFSELQQLSRSLMEVVDDLTNIHHTLEDQTQDMHVLLDQQGKVNKTVQQGLMRTRMVPFSTVIPRLRRVVRQTAQELGKQTELVSDGSEAEIDRTVLENMVAPLEHMLRNSIAHGIETPEQRRSAGKPVSGTIGIGLCREGAELVISVSDDGGGLNFDAIRAKGEAKGLLSPEQPVREQDLIALLLQPGFSTAGEVTQIAGRGVGMDVLNDAIKEMRGALHIQSVRGKGVTFTIRLPFSLALTQALLVEAGGETYAIPLLSIEAVARLSEEEMRAYLSGEVVEHEYGNHRYPIYSLGILFGAGSKKAYSNDGENKVPALLFRSAEGSAALQVDTVIGNQEIIVKPVAPQIHMVPGVSGATVLGDGRVVVVLELAALIRSFASQDLDLVALRAMEVVDHQKSRQDRISAMVIDDSITMRKVTARFLERHGIDVAVAKDGIEALELLEENIPDFVILDIEMPRMDGFEVVAHIRNHSHLKHIPILMVTSRSGEKHRERARKLGVNDYLIKPYQEDAIMQSIGRILAKQGLELKR